MDSATTTLSIDDLAAAIRAGRLTAERAMRDCLDAIEARDGDLEAYVHIDPAAALERAAAADRGDRCGPLAGLPFAVKDIIDTAEAPTCYGSAAYLGHQPAFDASCVALMRAAGAVLIGKTASTEFAMSSPAATRNPYHRDHTPGGSSSGSAVAVATNMAPVAFGTQTSGSVIRPAAYCGVVGYKPTFGWIDRTGVKPLAESLDTVGLMTRTVADVATVASVLTGRRLELGAVSAPPGAVGFLIPRAWGPLDAEAEAVLLDAVERLRRAGILVVNAPSPAWLADLPQLQDTVMNWEVTRSLAYERVLIPARISAKTRVALDMRLGVTPEDYDSALARAASLRATQDELFGRCDMLLAPVATGAAPEGLGTTGDPAFNRPWTLLHVPVVTLRAGTSGKGLPIGLQLIGRRGQDAALLSAARVAERALATSAA